MTVQELKPFHYPAILIKKKAWGFSLVSFMAEAGDLKCWTGVYRKEITEKGYQRILNPEHEAQIKKFLSDEKNVIPNSIVLAFNNQFEKDGSAIDAANFHANDSHHPADASGAVDRDTTVSSGFLQVFVHEKCLKAEEGDEISLSPYRSAFAIDGQHRISGGNAAGGRIYLPVTAFLGIDKEEQAFHFIVINRKARKVSKHDIDAVIPKRIYENLQSRLVSAGIVSDDADIVYGLDNLENSPFNGMISWANNKKPTAVISKGAIDNTLKQVRRLPSDVKESFENEIDLLISIWSGVKRHLLPIWSGKKYVKAPGAATYENQLITKAAAVFPAIQRALVAVSESGTVAVDQNSKDRAKSFEDSVYNYIKGLPLEFFYCVWTKDSITNESAIETLSKWIIKAVRTKRVPYGSDGDNWFKPPETLEGVDAKRKADRAAKATQKKLERQAKVAEKKARARAKAKASRSGRKSRPTKTG